MKIIAITDIHGRRDYSSVVEKAIIESDLVVIAGDLTDFGAEKEADVIIDKIKILNDNILAVPGNCDHDSVSLSLRKNGVDLQGKSKLINSIAFYGLGGSNKTPFATPQEYSDDKLGMTLHNFSKINNAKYHILISHPPPAKTQVDKTIFGLHVGSQAVRTFIEKFEPDLVICGHIHEAKGVDKIGKTIIINPGPFPKHYATINITEKIEYTLI